MITNDNISTLRKYNQHASTNWFKYVEIETFDTFYDDYIEFKYIDDVLKSLNFGKEFDSQLYLKLIMIQIV